MDCHRSFSYPYLLYISNDNVNLTLYYLCACVLSIGSVIKMACRGFPMYSASHDPLLTFRNGAITAGEDEVVSDHMIKHSILTHPIGYCCYRIYSI